MKQKIIPIIVCLLLTTVSLSAFVPVAIGSPNLPTPCFPGGSGTPGDPYHIVNVSDLQNMSTDLTASYILLNDIDASNTSVPGHWMNNGGLGFTPVGNLATKFTGTLDGQGFTIDQLFINRPATSYIGLIGFLDGTGALVSNITMTNSNITGLNRVGSLVGTNEDGTITNCTNYGNINGAGNNVGGIVGLHNAGTMTDCTNYGDTIGAGNGVGGITGMNTNDATTTNCNNYGNTTGTGNDAGGIVGRFMSGIIANCTNYGNTNGTGLYTGGIAASAAGNIINCTNYGNTNGTDGVGGIAGYHTNGDNTNCTNYGNINGTGNNVGGIVGLHNAGTMTDCTNYGDTIGAGNGVGGITGTSTSTATIQICNSIGTVTGNNETGGVTGDNSGIINNTYSQGDVNGDDEVGGHTGKNDGTISNSYSTGLVTGNTNVGGFCGNDSSPINDCFWDNQTSGQLTSSNGIGKTTAEMYQEATFTNWDFSIVGDGTISVWFMAGYPRLQMEHRKEITDVVELQLMEVDLGGDYTIMNYIDASDTINWNGGLGFYPIGSAITSGNIDGQNNTIDGLYIDRPGDDNIGLIGTLNGASALISNLTLMNSDITGNDNVGGFTGNLNGGTITNCTNSGDISGRDKVGGITGVKTGGATVTDCTNHGSTTGRDRIGGIAGRNNNGNITNCKNYGDTNGTWGNTGGIAGISQNTATIQNSTNYGNTTGYSAQLGGIVGWNQNTEIILNCTNYGITMGFDMGGGVGGVVGYNGGTVEVCNSFNQVVGFNSTGGVAGFNTGTINNTYSQGDVTGYDRVGGHTGENTGKISNSYSTGLVAGNLELGGFCGNDTSPINDCFWDIQTSGQATSSNGIGKTTIEMMSQTTFDPPWDFTTKWGIYEYLTYPFFQAMGGPVISADVGISITDSIDPIMAGDTFNYSVEVTNSGPYNAVDVQTVINLPWTVDYVSDNQTATVVDKNITWDIGLLLNGETVWLGIEVTENGTLGTTLLCNGTVTTTPSDPNTANNVTNETTIINRAPNAVDDNYNVDEDSGPNILVVLANDIDPDGDPFTITAITQGTHGTVAIINASKNVTYEPDADYTGSDTFTYTIDDGNGGIDTATVTVTVINVNDAPEITTTDITTATEDVLYSVDYNATDIDPSDTLIWSLETDAGWLSIVTSTGVLSGTPTNDDVGSFEVSVKVDDGNGGMDWSNFTLTVSNTNDAPVISTTIAPGGAQDQAYSLQMNASDADGDSLTWSLTSNATWLSINATGGLTGTPTSAGTFWANVTVNDGNGGTDNVNLTISITGTQTDTDTDGDGVPDAEDDFPDDPDETTDTDDDGTGDNADTDDDGDGVLDTEDAFPLDAAETLDTDDDGIGNNADTDDDGDGVPDTNDKDPLDASVTDLIDDPADDGSNTWLYLIIILVVVGVIAGLVVMKGKGKTPAAADERAEGSSEEATDGGTGEEGQETETAPEIEDEVGTGQNE